MCNARIVLKNALVGNSHKPSLHKLVSIKRGAVRVPSQLAHKSYAKAPRCLCRVFTATTQANPQADGTSLFGFAERRARSLSLYVNSSAFCPHATLNSDLHVVLSNMREGNSAGGRRRKIDGATWFDC